MARGAMRTRRAISAVMRAATGSETSGTCGGGMDSGRLRPGGARGRPTSRGPAHDRVDEAEGLVELGGVLAAGLGEVRPSTTAAADGPRDLLHEAARLHPLGEIFGHRRDEAHLAVDGAAHTD